MKTIFLPLLFLLPCFAAAQDAVQQQKDSLRKALTLTEGEEKLITYFRLTNLYYPEAFDELKRDTLLALYDEWDAEEARQGGNHRTAIRTNQLFVFQMVGRYDEVIQRAPEYLEFIAEHESWVAYYQSYQALVRAYNKKGDNVSAFREAQKMYEHAKHRQNKGGIGTAFYAMSEIYASQRRFGEQEKCLNDCISLLQELPRYYGLLANAYVNLCGLHTAQKRFHEALNTARALENFIPRYEETLRASQPNAWCNLWLVYLTIYRHLGDYNKAEIYLIKVDSISGNDARPLYEARAHILFGRNDYHRALETANRGIEEYPLHERGEVRKIKIAILAQMGDVDGSIRQLDEYIDELDSLHNAELNAKLDEIRTQYEVDTLEREKDSALVERQRNRNYFLFALGGCFLLALTLGIWMYYSRTIVRKNRGLYRQIKEQDRLAAELEQMTFLYGQLAQSTTQPVETGRAPSLQHGNIQQRQFVFHLQKYILDDRNYARIDIDRDDLAVALSTNRTTLSEAVRMVTGKTLMEYISLLRLEKAKQMLDSPSGFTVEAIAEECGFTYRTFYRLFKEHYHFSPSEYRKMVEKQG